MGHALDARAGRPRLKHRAEHLVFRRLLDSLASQPIGRALERGARLGRAWHALDRRHRRLAGANIARGLGLPPGEAARTAHRAFENIGRTLAEFAVATRRPDEVLGLFEVEGLEHLRTALAGGRGCFLVSAHCGNWELFGARLGREVALTSVARPMSNPLVDAEIAACRRAVGSRTMDARDATREIFRTLRRGEAVGMLLDQNALRRERVFVPFFGRPAATNFGLAVLALKSGAPVLPVFSARGEDGRHRGRVGPPIPPAEGGTREERVGRTTARYTAAIEAFVRLHPDQWFWVHDRWKRVPEADEAVWQP